MQPLPIGWRRIAVRLLKADQRTVIRRWAALVLAASFFMPLFSCTGQPPAKSNSGNAAGVVTAGRPAAEAIHVDFTPAASYSLASWQGVATVLVFGWPLACLGVELLRRKSRRTKVAGRVQVALCAASAAGIGWALWFGSHMPGFAPGAGAFLALGSLAAFAGIALRQIRSG